MRTPIPWLAMALIILAGCQSYQSLPFNPDDLLIEVNRARTETGILGQKTLSFADAAGQMSRGNSELLALKAEYEKLKAVSDIPTPWANPELEAGIASGRRLENSVASKTQPFVSLGFAIPLGPRLSREDDLNKVRTRNAWANLAARHRDLYLKLRMAYIQQSISQESLNAREQVIVSVNRARDVANRLSKAGTIGSLELTQMTLEAELENFELEENRLELYSATVDLADLLGVNSDLLGGATMDIPQFPDELPKQDELNKLMLSNSLALTDISRAFSEDDAALRLELAKQYPDLNIGGGFEQEVGEKARIFDLSIGLELPLFDLNKQGIAEAFEQRNVTLASYKSELSRNLTALEGLRKRYNTQMKQYRRLETVILPQSENLMRQAARAVDAGSWDFMRFLDMQREHRKLIMLKVEQKRAVWKTLNAIELLLGYPLSFFEGEETLIPKLIKQKRIPEKKE